MDWEEAAVLRDRLGYDLGAAIEYNSVSFDAQLISRVVAEIEGEHDGDNWHWLVELSSEPLTYVYLNGGCDYTGWDCQSWLEDSGVMPNKQDALDTVKDDNIMMQLAYQTFAGKKKTLREHVREALFPQ